MPIRRHVVRGVIAILGGAALITLQTLLIAGLWAVPSADPEAPAPPAIPEMMAIAALMFAGATAFNAPHRHRGRGLGTAGMVLLLVATGGDLVAGAGARMVLLLTYLFVWPLGLFVFGLAALRAKVYPAWCRAFPLLAAILWLPGLVASWILPLGTDAAFAPVTALLGGTWIAFGAVLIRGYRHAQPRAETWRVLPVDQASSGPR